MERRTRRRLNLGLLAVGGLVVAGAAAVGTIVGRPEQVDSYWIQAQVADDGSAHVSEVVDYDFASAQDKHGIYRVVPGMVKNSVTVSSPDAPDDVELSDDVLDSGDAATRIRIGSPNQTVSGEHRYSIDYELEPGEVVRDSQLDWETFGHEWPVPVEHAEIHLLTTSELVDVVCYQGDPESTESCDAEQVEPGHLVVTVDDLGSGESVSLEARLGDELTTTPTPATPPSPPSDDSGPSALLVGLLAGVAALIGGVYKTWSVRRAGRERVASTQAADAAFAAGGMTSEGEVRMDHEELAKLATVEFAPPSELTPAQGGIVHAEAVRPNHKVAWLIDAANQGAVELVPDDTDGDGQPDPGAEPGKLVRTGPGDESNATVLDRAFDGRDELPLGTYDSDFAVAWGDLGRYLEVWRINSGLWELRRSMDNAAAGCVGGGLAVLGAGAAFLGGWLLGLWTGWLVVAIAGGLLSGYALAMALGGYELAVRTPQGSATWLRVESFRRFLAQSETYHAEEAARRGVLREYTAWAVALDEIDHWKNIVAASSIPPATAGVSYAYMAPMLLLSTHRTAVQPSQSSSGGFSGGSFGGGGIGGGGGGGGGGSW